MLLSLDTNSRPLIALRRQGHDIVVDGDSTGSVGLPETGYFLEWCWDGTELRVQSHPYGFYPAYYVSGPDQFTLALKLPALVGKLETVDIDTESLSVFLSMGFWLGDRTAFRGIHAMPEGGEILWCPGTKPQLSKRPQTAPTETSELGVLMDDYIERFRAAVARAPVECVRLPLSGGKDSRHILLELQRQKLPIDRTLTVRFFPMTRTNDVEVARMLAERVGVEHQVIEQCTDLATAQERKNLLNGFSFLEGDWKAVLSESCNSHQYDIFCGIAGDVLSAGHFLNDDAVDCARHNDAHGMMNALFGQYPGVRRSISEAMSPIPLMPEADVHDLIRSEVAGYLGEHNPVSNFFLWNRTRRMPSANTAGIYGYGRIHTPFLDKTLFDFLRTLPVELILTKTFHYETMNRAYPEYSELPFSRVLSEKPPLSFRLKTARGLLQFVRRYGLGGIDGSRLILRGLDMIVRDRPFMFYMYVPQIIYCRQIKLLAQGALVLDP